jgi:large subunit ribosomal protein L36e
VWEVLTDGNSLAPYERRIIELLRNSKDKRARKLAKKKVRISGQTRWLDHG